MSIASRRLDLLTAAGLASADIQRERIKAQRDAALTGSWVSALGTSAQGLSSLGEKGWTSLSNAQLDKAKDLVLTNAGNVGSTRADPYALPLGTEGPLTQAETEELDRRAWARPDDVTGARSQSDLYKKALETRVSDPRPVPTAKPRGPFDPAVYDETPAQLAKRVVDDDDGFKPLSRTQASPLENLFAPVSNALREKGARQAKLGLMDQITRDRASLQTNATATSKALLDWQLKVAENDIAKARAANEERHHKATEEHGGKTLEETSRHNKALEAIGQTKADALNDEQKKAAAEVKLLTSVYSAQQRELSNINWGLANMAYTDKPSRNAAVARRDQLAANNPALLAAMTTRAAAAGISLPTNIAPLPSQRLPPSTKTQPGQEETGADLEAMMIIYDKMSADDQTKVKNLIAGGKTRGEAVLEVLNGEE